MSQLTNPVPPHLPNSPCQGLSWCTSLPRCQPSCRSGPTPHPLANACLNPRYTPAAPPNPIHHSSPCPSIAINRSGNKNHLILCRAIKRSVGKLQQGSNLASYSQSISDLNDLSPTSLKIEQNPRAFVQHRAHTHVLQHCSE